MQVIFHPLDHPEIALAVADLDLAVTPADWSHAVSHVVFSLLLRLLVNEPKAVNAGGKALAAALAGEKGTDVERILTLCARVQSGPKKMVANRPPGDFKARMLAGLVATLRPETLTKADVARIVMRIHGMTYSAAWAMAARAEKIGGYRHRRDQPFGKGSKEGRALND